MEGCHGLKVKSYSTEMSRFNKGAVINHYLILVQSHIAIPSEKVRKPMVFWRSEEV